jgi:Putative DNA-binding domain
MAGAYGLDSQSIFPRPRLPRFTRRRDFGFGRRFPVDQSLSSAGAATRMSEWRGPALHAQQPRKNAAWGRHEHVNPIGLLAARYPVTCRLVGRSSFRLAARRFICGNPLERPLGHGLGDDFPRFLRSAGNLACIEYVADVAELELLQHKAENARHAPPLATLSLAKVTGDRLDKLRLVLHPSVCLLQSRFPIVTTWENNRTSRARGMIERWVGEAAMVARPFRKVEVRRLPPGGYAFLRALCAGRTVATAAATVNEIAPFDVASSLRLIEDARVIVGVQH